MNYLSLQINEIHCSITGEGRKQGVSMINSLRVISSQPSSASFLRLLFNTSLLLCHCIHTPCLINAISYLMSSVTRARRHDESSLDGEYPGRFVVWREIPRSRPY